MPLASNGRRSPNHGWRYRGRSRWGTADDAGQRFRGHALRGIHSQPYTAIMGKGLTMMLPAVKFLGTELLPFVFVSLQEFGDVGEHGKADERAFAPFKILWRSR